MTNALIPSAGSAFARPFQEASGFPHPQHPQKLLRAVTTRLAEYDARHFFDAETLKYYDLRRLTPKHILTELKGIEGYTWQRYLGKGTFGEVSLYEKDKRLVALKQSADSRLRAATRSFFYVSIREAAIYRLLQGGPTLPGFMRLHNVFSARKDSTPIHVLELDHLEGRDLDRLIKIYGDLLSGEVAIWIAEQGFKILQNLEEKGVIYADGKPSNLMLTRSGQLMQIDFGYSKFLKEGKIIMGNNHYQVIACVPPEMVEVSGMRNIDLRDPSHIQALHPKGDLWSFGCVLFTLYTGKELINEDICDTVGALKQEIARKTGLQINNEGKFEDPVSVAAWQKEMLRAFSVKCKAQINLALGQLRNSLPETLSEEEVQTHLKSARLGIAKRIMQKERMYFEAFNQLLKGIFRTRDTRISAPQALEHPIFRGMSELFSFAMEPGEKRDQLRSDEVLEVTIKGPLEGREGIFYFQDAQDEKSFSFRFKLTARDFMWKPGGSRIEKPFYLDRRQFYLPRIEQPYSYTLRLTDCYGRGETLILDAPLSLERGLFVLPNPKKLHRQIREEEKN